MNVRKVSGILLMACLCASLAWAQKAQLATNEDILFLKRDLLAQRIKIGKTRLKDFRKTYGDAATITESDKNVIYEYGDLKITFEKKQYFTKKVYDYSHTPGYSEDINSLRSDLENGELVGKFVTLDRIRKDYGEPTEIFERQGDGEESVYYYGEIQLTFENVITVKSWKGAALDKAGAAEVLQTTESFTSAGGKGIEKRETPAAPVAVTPPVVPAAPAPEVVNPPVAAIPTTPVEDVTVQSTIQRTE